MNEPGLFEVMRTCRAMRRLKPDPVPEELLVRLIESAQLAPSGSNMQNSRWLVVRDAAIKARIAELNRLAVDRYLGRVEASLSRLEPAAAEARRRLAKAVRWQADHLAELPALVVACLELRGPRRDSFSAGVDAGGSIWPGVQNLLLAARALGLGATPTTLALSDREAFKAAVSLPDEIEPFCLIPVGYPRGKFGSVSRRPVSEVMRWDVWS